MKLFIDTEFCDFISCELISIGAVTEDGREFYAELTDYDKKLESSFVKHNVVPLLGQKIPGAIYAPRSIVSARFGEWIEGLGVPIKMCIDYITDWDLAVDLLEGCWPSNLSGPPENIYGDIQSRCAKKNAVASLDDVMLDKPPLHTVIRESRQVLDDAFKKHFVDRRNVPWYIQHHALFDARANRDGWFAAVAYINNLNL